MYKGFDESTDPKFSDRHLRWLQLLGNVIPIGSVAQRAATGAFGVSSADPSAMSSGDVLLKTDSKYYSARPERSRHHAAYEDGCHNKDHAAAKARSRENVTYTPKE